MSASQLCDESEPDAEIRLPGFPSVRVLYDSYREEADNAEPLWFEYAGTAEDLIAAGVATAAMLLMNSRSGPRHKRVDEDGDPYRLIRYWRSRTDCGEECPPYRYYRLRRCKPLGRLDRLPGSNEAVTARLRFDRFWERRRKEQEARPLVKLRLIVDNTVH